MSKRYNQDINNTFYILQIFFYNTVVLRYKERNGQQCEKSINLSFFNLNFVLQASQSFRYHRTE